MVVSGVRLFLHQEALLGWKRTDLVRDVSRSSLTSSALLFVEDVLGPLGPRVRPEEVQTLSFDHRDRVVVLRRLVL